jgi:hypothetical protein
MMSISTASRASGGSTQRIAIVPRDAVHDRFERGKLPQPEGRADILGGASDGMAAVICVGLKSP